MNKQYVISDIHGQYGLFKKLLKALNFDESDHLYVMGDVIDRGPESISLLLDIMQRDNITLLLGNHEFFMIEYLEGKKRGDAWLNPANGGRKTLEEYKKYNETTRQFILTGLQNAYLQKEVQVGGTTYVLGHSMHLPERPEVRLSDVDRDAAFDMVWYSA